MPGGNDTQILQENVYPILDQAFKLLINKIKDDPDIKTHQEIVQRQQIIDEQSINAKQKARIKNELGEDYHSSMSDLEHHSLGAERDRYQKPNNKNNDSGLEPDHNEHSHEQSEQDIEREI